MNTGRPTKLTPQLLTKAKKYISTCKDQIIYTPSGNISYLEVNLPSISSFATYLGINKDTVNEWSKTDQDFSVIVQEIKQEQETRLINKSLGGLYKSKTVQMLLAKHGYFDNEKPEMLEQQRVVQIISYQDLEGK